ncbi:MAG: hypothetical protein U5K75_07530 [Ahrensia sp.]|nr:hypothetical protein [Ahrensia sp.]
MVLANNTSLNFLRDLRVYRLPGDVTKGIIKCETRHIYCALGRSGPSVFKREGDGASPAHRPMGVVTGFFRGDRVRRPQSAIQFEALDSDDGWCDAPSDPNYNLPVKLPFSASHEVMMRDDNLYNIGLVLDWNMSPRGRARYRGSAIFMHLCRPGFQPTQGCIGLKEGDMRWLLRHIDANTKFTIMR